MDNRPFSTPIPSPVFPKLGAKRSRIAPGSYFCEFCELVFKQKTDFLNHCQGSQANNNERFLQALEEVRNPLEAPKTANDSNPKFHCEKCSKMFTTFKGYKQHLGKKHRLKRKNSKCKVCMKRFYSKYALKMHVLQVHDQSTKVECDICKKVLYNKYILISHIKAIHSQVIV